MILLKKVKKENTITDKEFLEWTKSVWTFPAVSAKSAAVILWQAISA